MLAPLVQLGDVVDLIGGGTPSKSNEGFYDGDIPWATVRDMKQEQLSGTEFKISEEAVKKSSTNIIEAGNIITATRVGLGKVCVLQQDTAINQDLKALMPKDDRLDKQYLFWWLKSVAHVIEAAGTGATVKGVKIPFVKALEVPLPSIPEQKRIVAILDQAFSDIDKARALTEQNLKNARELFESYLQQVFSRRGEGWIETTLGEVSEVSSGGTPVKSNKSFWGGNIPWYSSGELNEIYTTDSKAKITQNGLDGSNAKLFPKGSLLIGMYDTAALKMSILDRDGAFNQAIAGVKPKSNLNLEFVLHSINLIKPELLKLRRGVRQKNLNQSKIKSISLWLPSLDEQRQVVEKLRIALKQTEHLAQIYSDKLDNLDELKRSLLQKAFSGELTKDSEEAAA